jgi:hypothetical protein
MLTDITDVKNAINKLITLLKPEEVFDIKVNLRKIGYTEDEYYMTVEYIISDETISNLNSSNVRTIWNNEIGKHIKNYLGIKVYITASSMIKKSWYKK